jgi:hypothetical protein
MNRWCYEEVDLPLEDFQKIFKQQCEKKVPKHDKTQL